MIETLRAHPWLAASLMVLVPLALGMLVAIPLRRNRFGALVALALSVTALAAAWWSIPFAGGASAHDLLSAASLFSASALWTSRRWLSSVPAPVRWASLALALLGLGAMELWFRAQPPPPMVIPRPEHQMLVVPMDQREFGASALFPDQVPSPWLPGVHSPEDIPRRDRRARVLHLGDSMVAAGDVRPGEGFVDELSRTTGEDHLNLGVSSSSTDLHLTVFRVWQPRLRGERVVLHAFSGNDLDEIDRPYAYCDGGPLLGPRDHAMPLRCPTPRWLVSRWAQLAQGPMPYPLRILAWRSALARQVTWSFERWMRDARTRTRSRVQADLAQRAARLRDAMLTLRDECARAGVPLSIVVLPHHSMILRREPANGGPDAAQHSLVVAAARATGVPAFDLLPDLDAAVRANPGARWFLPPSPHFDVDGHRWYARWLTAHIGAPARPPPSR